jgi:hypothetical protein
VSGTPSDHPLVDGMNLAERNTTLTAAEQKDRELNNLAESQNLNSVLNNMHDAFEKFPYTNNGKGDYEARENAVDNGDFLKSIGAVTPDGKPDRVMGEKLQQEVTRQRAEWEKEAADKNLKAIDKYEPNIAKMTRPQIFQIPDSEIDAHGRSYLLSKWDENYRMNRTENLQERVEMRQERMDKSADIARDLLSDPSYLVQQSDLTPYILKGLSKGDAATVWEHKALIKDPSWQMAVGMLNNSPLYDKTTDEGRAKLAKDTVQFARTVQNKKLTGSQITDELQKELHPQEEVQHKEVVKGLLDNIWPIARSVLTGNFPGGGIPLYGLNYSSSDQAPQRPKGVPANAVWNREAKQWQLQQ